MEEIQTMKFQCVLLAVKDIEVSKRFYGELFNQKIVLDLGKNVTFDGGFAIQEGFAWLLDLPAESVISKSNNMELYFEVDDFDAFIAKLGGFEIRYVHPPKKYEWQQRVVRIYDPDWHIIEIGESMAVIARRYLAQGYSVEETAKIIQHPVEFVKLCKAGNV
jgi:catechol 2,3-dioxygenase-like lactoylglutathione lyase family enzyme